MALLSKRCVYGLRAAVFVAARPAGSPYVSIREIADELGLSFHFLTKILQQMTEAGFMESYRGPSGGVALAKDPRRISLLDLIDCIDGKTLFTECILGLKGCGERRPCPLHAEWVTRRAALRSLFERASLADVGQQTLEDRLRLAD